MKSIRIAGGGIAGLACAITLAKEGREVEVFERKKNVGGRFWGDLQGLENWTSTTDVLKEIAAFGLGVELPVRPLPPLYFIDGKGLLLNFSQSRPLCYLVKRGTDSDSLDQVLYRAALNTGVQIHLSTPLDVKIADVIATGPRAREVFAVDTGIHFQTNHPDIAVALVNDKAAYKGYAYLLIINGYGCICTVMFDYFKEIHRHFDQAFDLINSRFPIDINNPKKVGGVGSFSNDLCFSNEGQLFIGEAAGLQDLLWGFGIRSAIQSGVLAAHCLAKDADYEDEASRLFAGRLRSGIVLRYLFEKFGRLPHGYALMGKLVRNQTNPSEFLRKVYGFSPLHKLIFPLAKKGMQKRYPALYF